jgi:predicted dehydrogenase
MGKMGILHGGILQALDGVKVCAIADKEKLIPSFVAKILPNIEVYNDYKKMLDKENLDLVYITTPTSLHAAIAEECVDRGLNFFVEKPLGTSVNDCVTLVNKIKQQSVINMVGYCKHYVDTFRKAKQIIDSGILGDLVYLNSYMYVSQMFSPGRGWRYKRESSGGGVLNILATHLVDILLWFFGDISQVNGKIKSYYSEDVEDFVHSYLLFKSGLEGYLDASWSVRNYRLPEIRVEVDAKNGKLIVTDDYVKLYSDKTSQWQTWYKQDLYNGVDIDVGGPEYTREDKHMVESVRSKQNPETDVPYAFKVQKITDAIYESALKKAFVEINQQEPQE